MTRQQFELELDDAGGVRHAAGVYRRIGSPIAGPRDSAPRVDFSARDLHDVADDPTEIDLLKAYAEHPSDVYAAYVPIELVPAPVLAEEVAASEAMSDCAARQRELGWPDPGEDGYENCDDLYADSYDWDSLRMARSTPPAKLRVTRRGAVEILDGNHRVALWGERGFTHVPAWVIDERGHRAAVAAALAAGRRVPEAVRASYPDLLLTRPNPPPKGTRVSAYEEMGELWVEARSADGSFLGRVRVSMTDSYDERACGDLVPQAAEAVGADGLWLMTVNSSYVSPAYRGRGIGKALYLMALREARRRGAAIAPDTCAWGSTSPDARRVWESDEFRAAAVVVGRWPYVVAVPRKRASRPARKARGKAG